MEVKEVFKKLSKIKFTEGLLALEDYFWEADNIPGFAVPMAARVGGFSEETALRAFDSLKDEMSKEDYEFVRKLVVEFIYDTSTNFKYDGNKPGFKERIEKALNDLDSFLESI